MPRRSRGKGGRCKTAPAVAPEYKISADKAAMYQIYACSDLGPNIKHAMISKLYARINYYMWAHVSKYSRGGKFKPDKAAGELMMKLLEYIHDLVQTDFILVKNMDTDYYIELCELAADQHKAITNWLEALPPITGVEFEFPRGVINIIP